MAKKQILILSDGKLGHQNQSVRVAESLGYDYKIVTLKRRKCGKFLSFIKKSLIIKNFSKVLELTKQYNIVMGIGTSPRLAMLALKKKRPNLKIICIMDPKANYHCYDVVAIPNHDNISYKGDNLVRFSGSLSYFTQNDLDLAKSEFKAEFKELVKKPIIGLIVGGDATCYSFSMLKARELVDKVELLATKMQANIYATTSRRTGEDRASYIKYKLEKNNHTVYTGEGKNPFRAIIGYSDILFVTPETVSMLSEACASKSLVITTDIESVTSKRIKNYINELQEQGLLYKYEDIINSDISKLIEEAKNKQYPDYIGKIVEFIKLKIK